MEEFDESLELKDEVNSSNDDSSIICLDDEVNIKESSDFFYEETPNDSDNIVVIPPKDFPHESADSLVGSPADQSAEDGNCLTVPISTVELDSDGSSSPVPEDGSFVVDTNPIAEEPNNSAYRSEESIAAALEMSGTSSVFAGVISHHTPEVKEDKGPKVKRRPQQACWNCGSCEHAMTACPQPKDLRRIAQSRSNFRRTNQSNARFHEEQNRFQPGVLSDELRQALNIGRNELPPWIYRMRHKGLVQGYPPGYRLRATETSTFKFHFGDDASRKRKHADSDNEQGLRIDQSKLVRYLGFNWNGDGKQQYMDADQMRWLVPPWNDWVRAQQHHLDARYRKQNESPPCNKRPRMGETDNSSGEEEEGELEEEEDEEVLVVDMRQGANEELEEGEILDESSSVPKEVQQRKRKKKVTSKKPADPELDPAPSTSSSAAVEVPTQHMNGTDSKNAVQEERAEGTPIPLTQLTEVKKPSLDSWAKGILPFQHQSTQGNKLGFIAKLHQIVKNTVIGGKKNIDDEQQ